MTKEQNKKAPNLRFKGFTNDWEQRKLGEVADVGDGLHGTPKYEDEGEYYFINGNNLIEGRIQITEETKHVSYSELSDNDKALNNLTLLMSINGTIGQLAFYSNESIKLGKSVAYIRFGNLAILSFYYGVLMTSNTQQYFNRRVTGTTIKNLGLNEIRNFKYPIPNGNEQDKIGKLIKSLATLITLQQRKLEQFKQLKKALLQQLFVDKNNKQPNLRFKNFNGDWEQRKLGELIESLFQGINTAADKVEYSNNGLPIIQAKNITSGSLDFSGSRKLSVQKYSNYLDKYIPQKGDILFANIGTIGPNVILKDTRQFFIAWNILRIVPQKNINGEFLKITLDLLNSKHYFEKLLTGNATKFVNKNDMRNLPIFFSDPEEQNKISNLFKKLDFLITLQQQKLAKYQSIKKSLLQQMFI